MLIATFLPTVTCAAVWFWFLKPEDKPRPDPGPTQRTVVTDPLPQESSEPGESTPPGELVAIAPSEADSDTTDDDPGTSPERESAGSFGPIGGTDSEKLTPLVDPPDDPPRTVNITAPGEPTSSEVGTEIEQSDGKQLVPDQEELAAARQQVRDLFREKFSNAKAPEQKHALAHELYDIAMKTHDDPAARFVLFEEAIDLAVEVGDFSSALRTIGDMGTLYEFDRMTSALKVIQDASSTVRLPTAAARLTEACMMLSEYALEDSRFDVAELAVRIGTTNATRSKIPGLRLGVTQMKVRVNERESAWKAAEEARKQLETSPDDPTAHEQLGLWLSFVQNDREQGFEHLARSDDALLTKAVEADHSEPFSPEARTRVADAWLNAAESRERLTRARLQLRARHWLFEASRLASGLNAAQIEERIDQVDEQALGSSRTWLADFEPAVSRLHADWKLGIGTVRRTTRDGYAIVVNGQHYRRGLGMHPKKRDKSSMVGYALNAQYRTLVAQCAIAVSDNVRGDTQFSVIGDGKLLWWSRRVNQKDIVQTCNVSVKGVRNLELWVSCSDHYGAWACWLDPFLLKSEPPSGLELP